LLLFGALLVPTPPLSSTESNEEKVKPIHAAHAALVVLKELWCVPLSLACLPCLLPLATSLASLHSIAPHSDSIAQHSDSIAQHSDSIAQQSRDRIKWYPDSMT
jgi:hypothetical protein